jgi:imidazolonepropionase-like amidohydrolase
MHHDKALILVQEYYRAAMRNLTMKTATDGFLSGSRTGITVARDRRVCTERRATVDSWLAHGSTGVGHLNLCLCIVFFLGPNSISAKEAEIYRSVYQYPPIAIENVTVHTMSRDGETLQNATVLIREGRITKIGASKAVAVSNEFSRIDGTGKWLMPSLTDMHVHQFNARMLRLLTGSDCMTPDIFHNADLLFPYVANGILQLFNPAAMAEQIGLREQIEGGWLLGPHIELAAMVDGSPPIWPPGFSHVAATPADGRQFVRDAKAASFRFIKTYTMLDPDTFDAIVDEARTAGLRVVGHIPGRSQGTTARFFQEGFELVTHAEEYAYQTSDIAEAEAAIPDFVELARRTGTPLVSTLTLNERIVEQMDGVDSLGSRVELRFLHPAVKALWINSNPYAHPEPDRARRLKEVVNFNAKLVKAFADAGITVFPGTDAGVPGVMPGFSLHDEMASLAGAGLEPRMILVAATRQAAEWLGVDADRGTVSSGKRANLLLLDADPLEDVAHTRSIAAVIARGRYLPREELDEEMAAMAARYRDFAGTADKSCGIRAPQ